MVKGTYKLWDKDFNLIGEFDPSDTVYATDDSGESRRLVIVSE